MQEKTTSKAKYKGGGSGLSTRGSPKTESQPHKLENTTRQGVHQLGDQHLGAPP